MISRLAVYCQKRIAQRMTQMLAWQIPARPIISFTFDDFPRSALAIAGFMLLDNGVHGTYYVSMGLMGQESGLGDMFNGDDLQMLIADGHELACHTFSHLYCPRATTGDIQQDCGRNQCAVEDAIGGYRLRNFAFPSGGITWPAKSILKSLYNSCRTVESGINHNPIDLCFLRANPLYSSRPISETYRLIEQNREQPGWLLLYTHDVREDHSDVGCTPMYFRNILHAAVASGASIMTVAEAVGTFLV